MSTQEDRNREILQRDFERKVYAEADAEEKKKMNPTQEVKLETVIELLDKAHRYVVELSKGERRWDMHVPAQPDEDPDLVIGGAIREAKKFLTRPHISASHPATPKGEVR